MIWILRFAVTLLLWTCLGLPTGWACMCISNPPPLQALARADFVFSGMVVGREEPPPRYILYQGDSVRVISGGDMLRWRLATTRGWKGEPGATIAVYSPRDEAACGVSFRVGESYLIYGYFANADSWIGSDWPEGTTFPARITYLCTRTQSLDWAGTDLIELGAPAWVTDRVRDPATLRIDAVRPNPSPGKTTLRYGIAFSGRVRLSVYDGLGRLVVVIRDRIEPVGWRTVEWDGRDGEGRRVASGTYFARLESGGAVLAQKIVLTR